MANERIGLGMSFQDVISAMSEGNPGALEACVEVLEKGEKIDPDSMLGGFGALLTLDMLNIYGSRIYLLWDYVCRGDVGMMLAVMRAKQMGELAGVNKEAINRAIDGNRASIDLDAVLAAVRKELPNFYATTPGIQTP